LKNKNILYQCYKYGNQSVFGTTIFVAIPEAIRKYVTLELLELPDENQLSESIWNQINSERPDFVSEFERITNMGRPR
jgi:hypothetical protein